MFYSIHLLSHRSKGKLAPCWLAAMNRTNTFKKYYNTATIKKIDITITCKEILQAIQLHNGKRRFSLYLSSQLMYGITRIFSYQVEYYQKELFEIWKIFSHTITNQNRLNKLEENFNAVRALDTLPEIELPLMKLKLVDHQMKEDLHILPGEIPDDALKVLMKDATCLNFGALTNEELDFMLEHNNDITLHTKLMIQITDNKHKNATMMTTDVEITSEIHREMHSPQALPSPMLVNKSKIASKSKEKLSSTPQKRRPLQPQVETPSKRRRISLENIELPVADTATDVTVVPLEDISPEDIMLKEAQMRTLSVRDMELIASSQHLDMELESLHSSLNTFLVKKKKLVIDKRIVLRDTVLKKWRQNINFQCREMEIPRIHRILSVDRLTRPLHYYVFAQSLRNLFVNHSEKPCKSTNEYVARDRARYQEEVRGLQRTVDDHTHTGPITSKLIDLEQLSIEQFSAVPIQTTWAIDKSPHKEAKADLDDTNGSLEDIEIILKNIEISATRNETSLSSSRSIEKSQYALLTSREIIAMLEVLWHNHPYVKFNELIPKNADYTKQDAATVFYILLELHSQKKVILSQHDFCCALWIQKYEDYN